VLRSAPEAASPDAVRALAADVGLITSELASNAVRHAATPFEVVLDVDAQQVRVEVRDRSTAAPQPGKAQPGAATGRGLVVVDRVASSWGVERAGNGKVVWAAVPVRPPAVLAPEPRG
jgi:anti-sigma regulatory factor (Ser/Thr protein kinase)